MPSPRNQRAVRLQFVVSLVNVGVGLVILTLRDDIARILYGPDYYPGRLQIVLFPGLIFVALGVGGLLLLYLRGAVSIKVLDNLVSVREEEVDRLGSLDEHSLLRLTALEAKLQEVAASADSLRSSQAGLAMGDKTELLASVLPTIHTGVADELEKRFAAAAQAAAALVEIRQVIDRAHRRLHTELESLSRRSNLNLVIGVLTTSLAVSLLAYMVLGHGGKFDSITDLLGK